VVVGYAVAFENISQAFFAREKRELDPSLIALAPAVLASLEQVDETSNGFGGDSRQCGDAGTLPLRLLLLLPHRTPVAVPSSRHRAQHLDAPVLHVLPGRERDDQQIHEARELLVRQVRDGNRKLTAVPHGYTRHGCTVVCCDELRHARRRQRRFRGLPVVWVQGVINRRACGCECIFVWFLPWWGSYKELKGVSTRANPFQQFSGR